MNDIVDRLRANGPGFGFYDHDPTFDLRQEAANEIERLRSELLTVRLDERNVISKAARDVIWERNRQINVEGWVPAHDDTHVLFEMSRAAAFYALHTAAEVLPEPTQDAPSGRYGLFLTADQAWPPQWDNALWKKPKDARSNLVRAAALIVAEIERLDRAAAATEKKDGDNV